MGDDSIDMVILHIDMVIQHIDMGYLVTLSATPPEDAEDGAAGAHHDAAPGLEQHRYIAAQVKIYCKSSKQKAVYHILVLSAEFQAALTWV
jgi:hypothetical protein